MTDPYNWVKQFSNCITTESTLQSPIELKPVGIKNDSISSLQLRGFSVPQKSWTVVNVGDTGMHNWREKWHKTIASVHVDIYKSVVL